MCCELLTRYAEDSYGYYDNHGNRYLCFSHKEYIALYLSLVMKAIKRDR